MYTEKKIHCTKKNTYVKTRAKKLPMSAQNVT